jgi:hypothetical protein
LGPVRAPVPAASEPREPVELARFPVGAEEARPHRVEFVVSDNHEGLKAAIREVLPEAAWQRCYVHFLRNALDYVPRKSLPPRRRGWTTTACSFRTQLVSSGRPHSPNPHVFGYDADVASRSLGVNRLGIAQAIGLGWSQCAAGAATPQDYERGSAVEALWVADRPSATLPARPVRAKEPTFTGAFCQQPESTHCGHPHRISAPP